MTGGVGGVDANFLFPAMHLLRGEEKGRGKLTESVSVALNSYHYMLHTALDTLVKGTYH